MFNLDQQVQYQGNLKRFQGLVAVITLVVAGSGISFDYLIKFGQIAMPAHHSDLELLETL
jgi:hypothetical protein